MEFKEQTITIKDGAHGTKQVKAIVGIGTGLAYLPTLDTENKVIENTYNLTHLRSGYALPYHVETAEEAQLYLENATKLLDNKWNCNLRTLKPAIQSKDFNKKLQKAHFDALTPHNDCFLYARNDAEIFTESHTDAFDEDPEHDVNQRIATRLLRDYPEATKVIMTRMDDGGVHHDLRTFQRESVAQA